MPSKKKVLIIDDELEVQALLNGFLTLRGYETFSARDGEDGLKMVKTVRPDVIILDIMMPQIDGFKVQQKLSEDKASKSIPVLFITGKTTLDNAVKAISQGAAGYIEKPFDVKVLAEKLESILDRKGT